MAASVSPFNSTGIFLRRLGKDVYFPSLPEKGDALRTRIAGVVANAASHLGSNLL
jgi:hypothetical protein